MGTKLSIFRKTVPESDRRQSSDASVPLSEPTPKENSENNKDSVGAEASNAEPNKECLCDPCKCNPCTCQHKQDIPPLEDIESAPTQTQTPLNPTEGQDIGGQTGELSPNVSETPQLKEQETGNEEQVSKPTESSEQKTIETDNKESENQTITPETDKPENQVTGESVVQEKQTSSESAQEPPTHDTNETEELSKRLNELQVTEKEVSEKTESSEETNKVVETTEQIPSEPTPETPQEFNQELTTN